MLPLKPPLCKGRWHAVRRDGGIVAAVKIYENVKITRKRRDLPSYTAEQRSRMCEALSAARERTRCRLRRCAGGRQSLRRSRASSLNTREPLNSIILDIFPYIWYSVIRGFQHFKARFGRCAEGCFGSIYALGGGNLFLFVDIPPSLELRPVRNRFSHQRAAHMRLLFSAIPSALSEIRFLPLRS